MTVLKLSQPFNPCALFQCNPKTWRVQSETSRSLGLSEIDLDKVELITVLRDGEEYLDYFSFEMYDRLKEVDGICLDGRILQALMGHCPAEPSVPSSWKEKCESSKWNAIYFPGSILLHYDNYNSLAGMCLREGRWVLRTHNPSAGCTKNDLFAILRM